MRQLKNQQVSPAHLYTIELYIYEEGASRAVTCNIDTKFYFFPSSRIYIHCFLHSDFLYVSLCGWYCCVYKHNPRTGPTMFILPKGMDCAVDPGAILHYDQSLEILEPLDPRGAELEGR